MADPFIGEIKAVAFNFAPQGYAFANGTLMPINQYQAVYSLLSTAFGGDGDTTFGLPDLQSRAPVGYATKALVSGLSSFNIGIADGAQQIQLSQIELPTHNHNASGQMADTRAMLGGSATAVGIATGTGSATGNISIPVQNAGAATNVPGPSVVIGKPGAAAFATAANSNLMPFSASLATTVTVPIAAPVDLSKVIVAMPSQSIPVETQSAGFGKSFSILNPFLAVNYIIALEGIYPVRN